MSNDHKELHFILKDAMAAKTDVRRLRSLIDSLKGLLADQVKSVTELKTKVKTAKKVTDKAFSNTKQHWQLT